MKKLLLLGALSLSLVQGAMGAGDRGDLAEYDPGAPKTSKWPDLFAETPNYRAFGQAVIGGQGEKFRWIMGPMWYRGRLTPDSVKVFVVGQEGAQDENVSNRSFTGSTGTRMQKLLNYLGVDRSYLFMNTFVYTITGQYSLFDDDRNDPAKVSELKRLLWLAQDEESIVVKHRHALFDYMLETNGDTLELVIGVGTAGKDSVATWFRAHGSECTSSILNAKYCEGKGDLKGVYAIGVAHPGAASARNGGAGAADKLQADFQNKAATVAGLISKKLINLPTDSGMTRNFSKNFQYGHASIPHRDFAYGTTFRMGEDGTASNRRGQDTVQIYSKNGCYNNTKKEGGRCSDTAVHNIKYDVPKDLLGRAPKEMASGDVPYESPKSKEMRREFDAGPGSFAKILSKFAGLDYTKLGVTSHASFGPNGVYRGRLDEAKVLVIADQVSHTDMFSGRALTGAAGQRLQSFLNAMGATRSYAILRTLPVDTLDLSLNKAKEIALDERVAEARANVVKQILEEGKTKLVVAVGPVAAAVVEQLSLRVPSVQVNIADPALKHVAEYQKALQTVKSMNVSLDGRGSFNYKGDLTIIPRADLPEFTRWWMGTSGDLAVRAYEVINGKRVDNPDYYKVNAPAWASRNVKAGPLSAEERESIEAFKKTGL
ncbi:MAG: hypothetical protein A2X86_10700 [Bdellovibrionales bacterium GWA2_49_15]|nr:MAG: hypothetical protein A2X86_10700 [Bdellovibrionales bacterium GWA2_49_15]HAZ11444.1 hypothetical protein [Bdellovibrionales bacterium]